MIMIWKSTNLRFRLFWQEDGPLKEKYVRKYLDIGLYNDLCLAPKCWVMENMGPAYKQTYFQQRLVPLETLYNEKHLQRLSESEGINSQFIQTVTCEEYEKQMYEAILQKQVMNGSVVDLI